MKVKVLFIAGNISNFDATPIKIYDYIKATTHLVEKPTLLAILDFKNYFDQKKKKEVKDIFSKAGIPLKYTIRIFPFSLLSIYFLFKFGRFEKLYANNLTAGINVFLLKKVFRTKYVFDYHGSIPEERVLIGLWKANSLKYNITKRLEKEIAKSSEANVAISSEALNYLDCIENTKPNLVIPCGINFDPYTVSIETRNEKRNELNLEDKFVVLYSGSISPWNDYELMSEVVQKIKNSINNFILLILSKDPSHVILDFVNQMGLNKDEFLHLSLSHTEIQDYTSCADIALLIRKKSVVNKISSPMKFGEYIGAGVPVLISNEIGDASSEVEINNLGAVIRDLSDLNRIKQIIDIIKENRNSYFERNRKFAANNYRLTSVLDKYKTLYNV